MRQELAELSDFQRLFKFLNEDISLLYAQVSDFATKGAKQQQSVNQ
jgi:hypothetical protein